MLNAVEANCNTLHQIFAYVFVQFGVEELLARFARQI
ncbi:hypothetical protein CBM2637_B110434 [Cupriavidus taiwanensis]|nr:hypothetical protein CBM2637_B110434 [Cupriavidus taiwanensis]